MEQVTVYAVYLNMTSDVPALYTIDKWVVDHLCEIDGSADYVEMTMSLDEWTNISIGKRAQ